MEESGCDQGEAELALSLAGYDLEKAVRAIGTLLRHIVAVKTRFIVPAKGFYGLVIVVADTKRKALLRVRTVVSLNPALYETALEDDWYDFEKSLFACRLWEGALQQATQELEHFLTERMGRELSEEFFSRLGDENEEAIKGLFEQALTGYYADENLPLSVSREELNLEQYRRLRPRGEAAAAYEPGHPSLTGDVGKPLELDVALEPDEQGYAAGDIKAGDTVFVLLTDERDIARYLSRLLGGVSPQGPKALPIPVEDVRRQGNEVIVTVRLSVGVLGLTRVPALMRFKADRRSAAARWWHKILGPNE